MSDLEQSKDTAEGESEKSLPLRLSEADTVALQEAMHRIRLAQTRLDRLGIKLHKKYQIGQQDRLWEDGEITRE